MPATPLTLAQIKTYPAGTPVPMVRGVLSAVYERRTGIGKHQASVQSAMLKDGGEEMRINIWNHQDYTSRKGSMITIIAVTEKGRCSTRTTENDYHKPPQIELEVTKTSQILFSGDAGEAPPPDHSESEEPEQTSNRSQPVRRPISGQNVGMCVKEAIGLVKEAAGEIPWEYLKSPDFSKDVWTIASDLIRVSRLLEDGKFAPSAKDRANPPPLKPEPPPAPPPPPPAEKAPPPSTDHRKPGPDGAAFDPNDPGIDEDVPF